MTINFRYGIGQDVWINDKKGIPRQVKIFIARVFGETDIDYFFEPNKYCCGRLEKFVYATEQEARENLEEEKREVDK